MSKTESKPKTETTTIYFDMEGKKVEDKSKAVRFWIREIDPKTKELIHEQFGFFWENFPEDEKKEDDNNEDVENTEPGV